MRRQLGSQTAWIRALRDALLDTVARPLPRAVVEALLDNIQVMAESLGLRPGRGADPLVAHLANGTVSEWTRPPRADPPTRWRPTIGDGTRGPRRIGPRSRPMMRLISVTVSSPGPSRAPKRSP
ncbi:hypothetical protein [Streptomyces sp. WMMC940]|uniref:hypothetical protein n=1 Tax=Streptomyces sp. WMMC940 TaxID=3015153 RepID=UPI0022B7292A|nr:hypothetical protein [Streptomyces sp. WMMC940]MCZ7462213.1 hypothetical protein [Streptomyces sp. WMMC940]